MSIADTVRLLLPPGVREQIDREERRPWQKRRELTSPMATHSRDGRPYERDQNGTIRKGPRPS